MGSHARYTEKLSAPATSRRVIDIPSIDTSTRASNVCRICTKIKCNSAVILCTDLSWNALHNRAQAASFSRGFSVRASLNTTCHCRIYRLPVSFAVDARQRGRKTESADEKRQFFPSTVTQTQQKKCCPNEPRPLTTRTVLMLCLVHPSVAPRQLPRPGKQIVLPRSTTPNRSPWRAFI